MSRIVDLGVDLRRGADGRPAAFRFRRRWRRIAEVIEEWVYRDPWWEAGAAEHTFYRVRVEAGGVFEIALEADGSARLHRVFD